MSGTVVDFPYSAEAGPPPSEAPALPIEHHIVAAALTAERIRSLSEQMVLMLRHVPRDAAIFARLHDEMLSAWCDVDSHYGAYRAVLECKGQA